MKIIVTQQHIQRGKRGSASDCPLAIAISEQCPAYETSVASVLRLKHLLDEEWITVGAMPDEAIKFFVRFDKMGSTAFIKQHWWQWGLKREYAFDLPIPESCSTESVRRASVLGGNDKHLADQVSLK